MTSSNTKTAQRSAESISHPCEILLSVPQLLKNHCCLLPTEKSSLCSAWTRPPPPDFQSGRSIKCWDRVQSRPDGCECINTEWYPVMFSTAWYITLERKGIHGHAPSHCTFTKQDLQVKSHKFHKPKSFLSIPVQQQGLQLHQSCGVREARLISPLPGNRPGLQEILPTARAHARDCDTTSQSAAAVASHLGSVIASAQAQTSLCTHSRHLDTNLGSTSSAGTKPIHSALKDLWGKAVKKGRWQSWLLLV